MNLVPFSYYQTHQPDDTQQDSFWSTGTVDLDVEDYKISMIRIRMIKTSNGQPMLNALEVHICFETSGEYEKNEVLFYDFMIQ